MNLFFPPCGKLNPPPSAEASPYSIGRSVKKHRSSACLCVRLSRQGGGRTKIEEVRKLTPQEASARIDQLKTTLGMKITPRAPHTPQTQQTPQRQGFSSVRLGLASKLVNERWIAGQMNPLKYPSDFIHQVEQTYSLLERAEKATNTA